MKMQLGFAALALASVILAACETSSGTGTAKSTPDDAAIADGQFMAQRECSGCHATGLSGASPRPDAPPFRTVLGRYHADMLEMELVNGIRVAHPMPEFELNPKAVHNLIVYLKSLRQ